jgi:hypothetical protein
MPDSPLAASPYEVLGVPTTATDDELRRAYRRRLRQTHPDTAHRDTAHPNSGGAAEFDRVQRAWALIGTADARAAYDRGARPSADDRTWAPAPPRREGTRPAARMHGHPGGWYRVEFLTLLQEWVGRGVDIPDPYDPQLLARAPRELRHLLAEAVAEEDTARALATLGIGFTVWHDLRTHSEGRVDPNGLVASPQGAAGKLDHVVLGPSGLWAMLSEDWGEPVSVKRGEVIGRALDSGERPVHELSVRARRFARAARVRFSALVVVVPDGASPEGVMPLGSVRGAQALLVQRPRLVDLVRSGIPGVGVGGTDLFEVRTRVQAAARFV